MLLTEYILLLVKELTWAGGMLNCLQTTSSEHISRESTIQGENILTSGYKDKLSHLSLSKYEKAALLEHAAFMSGLEGLKQLYKTNATPFVLARNVGTMLVNNNSALKDIFISRAS